MRSRSLKLLEYETKAIFNAHNIPIPRGRTAKTPDDAENIANEISDTVVLKAQVPFGGRGKAGGIKSCETPKDATEIARSLFDKPLKGATVDTLLVEEKLQIAREFYFGITTDRAAKTYVAITSSEGGVDIEEVASKSPEKIIKKTIDPTYGFQEYHARNMTSRLNLKAQKQTAFGDIMLKLYRISIEYDAELIEINPLVETLEGKFVAADARLVVDDNALFRHKELETQTSHRTELSPSEAEARKLDMAYVDLDGDIGIIGNG
ncbi:MAG: ATP-grasp domain-containing protein, partial [Candidatus Bathyarchaeia archaeon]